MPEKYQEPCKSEPLRMMTFAVLSSILTIASGAILSIKPARIHRPKDDAKELLQLKSDLLLNTHIPHFIVGTI